MLEINRKEFLTIASVLLLQAGVPFAEAATSPSLKPSRVGQSIIWRGKKYTAIKSGRKIIWNRGVALTSPKATSTPLPRVADVDLAASRAVPEGETRVFYPKDPNAWGKGFFVSRANGTLTAFDTICTHEGCQVQIGFPQLTCGCHQSFFNRVTGAPEGGPAKRTLRTYKVKEAAGRIIITHTL